MFRKQDSNLVRLPSTPTPYLSAKTAVFVASSVRGPVQVDVFSVFEPNYPCNVARGAINVLFLLLFFALKVNISNTAVKLAKHRRFVLANPPLSKSCLLKTTNVPRIYHHVPPWSQSTSCILRHVRQFPRNVAT